MKLLSALKLYGIAIPVLALLVTGIQAKVSGQQIYVCSGVCDAAFSPTDSDLLAAVTQAGLWLYYLDEVESEPRLFSFENATSLNFAPDGQSIVVTACNPTENLSDCSGMVSIFDLNDESWYEIAQYDYEIDDVQFSPDGSFIAFVQYKSREQGFLRIINLSTNESTVLIDDNLTVLISSFAFSPNTQFLAISNGDLSWQNRVSVWDLSTAQIIAATDVDGYGLIENVSFSSDSSVYFVKSDASVFVWDFVQDSITLSHVMTQTLNDNLHEYKLNGQPPYLLGSLVDDWHPRDRTLYVWDLKTGDEIFSIDISPDYWHDVLEINISGEFFVASDSGFDIVDIWEVETGEYFQLDLSR